MTKAFTSVNYLTDPFNEQHFIFKRTVHLTISAKYHIKNILRH